MGLSTGVINPMMASGGLAPVSLLEVLTRQNALCYWSDRDIANAPSVLAGSSRRFQGWITGESKFTRYGTTQTDTGSVTIQNLSGNTVTRDVRTAFAQYEFTLALVYYRLWRADAERSIFTFVGSVTDVEIDDDQMELTLAGFGDWSQQTAPAYSVDVNCPLYFGSIACGSSSSAPCQNTYGTCSSIERFAGEILQWDGPNLVTQTEQYAQPAPLVQFNPSRAF